MNKIFDEPIVINYKSIVLQNLSMQYLQDLQAVSLDASLWQYSIKPLKETTPHAYEHHIRNLLQEKAIRKSIPLVILNQQTHKAIGEIKLENINPSHLKLDINEGWVGLEFINEPFLYDAYCALVQYCFGKLAAIRIGFLFDQDNTNLLRIIESLGASFEGTLRYYLISSSGQNRNYLRYSIIKPEWERIKYKLGEA